jgi:phage terminase large subunit GpA-like protein
MDCSSDPEVEGIVIVKPTRIGGTDGPINNVIGFHIHHDPCDILYAQSSKDQGELYSDSILMPMLRDTPVLAERLIHELGRKATQTKTKKYFVGGATLRIIGAKSPKGFQAIQARLAIGDDLDEWEASKYGDPVQKLIDRTKGIWNKKIILVSFPTRIETSRIWAWYLNTDMRERWVPCPICGKFQILKFGGPKEKFGLKWRSRTADPYYLCVHCEGEIKEFHKDDMNTKGEWRPGAGFNGWAGFKLNPFLRSWHDWSEIRNTFLMAGNNPDKLMVFTNQTLGDVYEEDDHLKVNEDMLFARREVYLEEAPRGVRLITAAVDTQDERLECKVMGWGMGEESWVLDFRIFNGSPIEPKVWNALDTYLFKQWKLEASGLEVGINSVAIDAGGHYSTQVYEFTKPREGRGIYAIRGSNDPKADILEGPMKINTATGAKYQRIGPSNCKMTLLGRLRLKDPKHTGPYPGYIHFPMSLKMEYFRQLLGKKPMIDSRGVRIWQEVPGRRHEAMDLYCYNLAALRMLRPDWEAIERTGHISKGRLVYKNHSVENEDDSIRLNKDFPIIICCDFKTNPLVWVLAQTNGVWLKAFDEIARQNGTTSELAIEVQRRYGGHEAGFLVRGSVAGTIASRGKSEYAVMRDYGFGRHKAKRMNPSEHELVNATNNMLENLAGIHRLTYHPRCMMLKRDFEQAVWLEDMSEIDRTDFGRGNAAQALGYYIDYRFPVKGPKKQGRTHWK